jgi:hypothetical protein
MGRKRYCEEVFKAQLDKIDSSYIQAEKFGVELPDGSIVPLTVDVTGEVEDSKFTHSCEAYGSCRYVDIQHSDKIYALMLKDYYFVNHVKICFVNNKKSNDDLDKLVYFKDGQWNSLCKLIRKCNLIGKTKRINDVNIGYPIASIYKEKSGEEVYKTVVTVRKMYLSEMKKFLIVLDHYTIEDIE